MWIISRVLWNKTRLNLVFRLIRHRQRFLTTDCTITFGFKNSKRKELSWIFSDVSQIITQIWLYPQHVTNPALVVCPRSERFSPFNPFDFKTNQTVYNKDADTCLYYNSILIHYRNLTAQCEDISREYNWKKKCPMGKHCIKLYFVKLISFLSFDIIA